MIQELELSDIDPLVVHFKQLFEMNKTLHTFIPNQLNSLYMEKQHRSFLKNWLNDKYIVDDDLSTMISIVKDLMKQNGFETDDSTGAFSSELHYSYTTRDGIMSNTLTIHEDDYSSIDYPVNTFILYLDVRCSGGELVFYNKNLDVTCSHCLFSEPIYEPFHTVNTHNPTDVSCKAVIFNGSIYHQPNVVIDGDRLSIVIQIPRI